MKTKLFSVLSLTALFLVACGPSAKEIADAKAQATADSLAVEAGKTVEYMVDPAASTVMWEGNMTGAKIYGHSGDLKFVKGMITTKGGILRSGEFVVDMTSINPTDDGYSADHPREGLIDHLSTPDFFDVANNPTAMLKILEVSGNVAKAELTIRGKSNNEKITDIETSINPDGSLTATGKLTFDRQKYGAAFSGPAADMVIANNVDLTVKLTAKAK